MDLVFSCVDLIGVGFDICDFEGRVESCHKQMRYLLTNRPISISLIVTHCTVFPKVIPLF